MQARRPPRTHEAHMVRGHPCPPPRSTVQTRTNRRCLTNTHYWERRVRGTTPHSTPRRARMPADLTPSPAAVWPLFISPCERREAHPPPRTHEAHMVRRHQCPPLRPTHRNCTNHRCPTNHLSWDRRRPRYPRMRRPNRRRTHRPSRAGGPNTPLPVPRGNVFSTGWRQLLLLDRRTCASPIRPGLHHHPVRTHQAGRQPRRRPSQAHKHPATIRQRLRRVHRQPADVRHPLPRLPPVHLRHDR